MKCDELKAYNVVVTSECNDYICGQEQLEFEAYAAKDVDAAIAAKDAEIRKAKRALWAYRAMIAKKLKKSFGIRALYNPLLSTEEHKWEVVERKCRTKVNEYMEGK